MLAGDALTILWQGVAWLAPLVPLMGRAPLLPTQLAESPVRRDMLDIVRREPGIPLVSLHRRIGIGWGAFYHHVAKLRGGDLVEVVTAGGRCLLYPRGHAGRDEAGRRAVLFSEPARRVARAVLARPGVSMRDVLAAVDDSPRVVYYHLRRLVDAGLVTSRSPVRHRGLEPAPGLARLLDDVEAEVASPASPRGGQAAD